MADENTSDTNIYIYPGTNKIEAVEFIEDDNQTGFYSGGIIHAGEFVETSSGIYIGSTKIQAVELCER